MTLYLNIIPEESKKGTDVTETQFFIVQLFESGRMETVACQRVVLLVPEGAEKWLLFGFFEGVLEERDTNAFLIY